MTEIEKLSWYTLPPVSAEDYFGTIKDWTQTLVTKINQGNKILSKNRGSEEVLSKKVVVPNWFKKQFEMLEYYNPSKKNLAGRYVVEFSDKQEITVCENNFYVTITLINENYR